MGGAHCLDMDKLVRRAGSLALATSPTHKLVVHFKSFLRLLASCIHGEVASIFHSSGYITLIVYYIRIDGKP